MLYFLLTDETNQRPSEKSQFFIYGGLFLPAEALQDLHDLVDNARRDNGYAEGDQFKFAISSKPAQVSSDQFRAAKRAVLKGCGNLGIRFVACLTLHEIARHRTLDELVGWGANTEIGAFDRFLVHNDAKGICVTDRLPFDTGFRYLQEKFQKGLIFPNGNSRRLSRILLFASTCEGASHASSAVDIVLGSFRYCVNEREKDRAPREMLPVIASMMWHRKQGNTIYLREYGLMFRPKQVRVAEYEKAYDDLVAHFTKLLT